MSPFAAFHTEAITFDDVSATAIAEQQTDGRPRVISGRCYVEQERVDGHRVLKLRIEAEHWVFAEIDAMSDEPTAIEDVR